MTRALIVGAGLAGPVAAMALQRAGIEAVVYEAHADVADDIGAFLTLQSNGLDALRAIGAQHTVAGRGFPTPTIRIVSGSGRHLGEVPNGGTLPDGTVSHTLKRTDLYRALRDEALARGLRIEHGRRLVDARRSAAGGRVTAVFADGGSAEGDLLIGCDGIRSRVRQLIDPAAPPARYVSLLNLGGYARGVSTAARPGEYVMVFGKHAFFGYTVAPGGEIWWFANPPHPEEPSAAELAGTTTRQWRDRLLELFAADRSPAAEIIRATPGELRGWATYDLPRVRTWHDGAMVVIGDAAHATAPSSGQGASMAIEDAVVLAKCLRDLPDVPAAFTTYERLRRRRVERVVAHGARTSSSKVAGPVARVLRDLLAPLVLKRVASKGVGSLAWMHAHHIDWATPVAEDVAAVRVG